MVSASPYIFLRKCLVAICRTSTRNVPFPYPTTTFIFFLQLETEEFTKILHVVAEITFRLLKCLDRWQETRPLLHHCKCVRA